MKKSILKILLITSIIIGGAITTKSFAQGPDYAQRVTVYGGVMSFVQSSFHPEPYLRLEYNFDGNIAVNYSRWFLGGFNSWGFLGMNYYFDLDNTDVRPYVGGAVGSYVSDILMFEFPVGVNYTFPNTNIDIKLGAKPIFGKDFQYGTVVAEFMIGFSF